MAHTLNFEFNGECFKYEINSTCVGGYEGYLVRNMIDRKEQFHIYKNNLGKIKNDNERYCKEFNEVLMLLVDK